ncbi:hypothetical protein EHV23_00370 [Lautropia dentalis]|uniref:DUF4351 domain-containing protein n=1 Tax=Lautropia dentalis TaxID=2490857 RepID=A0A3R8LRT5_9BURK|nr:hypothetical protein [Lautropia dentalis]RRN44789.1 hypothetical protein EHV23_00370 [Lautropia dentalis]
MIPIVISLKRGTMEVEMAVGGDYVQPLPFRVPHCHLAMLDALDHAHSPNIAVRILTVMMGYPNTPEARVRVFGQAWQGLLALEPDPDQLFKYLGIIQTWLKLDAAERQLYKRLYPQEKRRMNQLAERLIRRGRQEGLRKGLQEGRQEGVLDGRQQTLAEQLAERFGPLDEAVTRRLASASLDELKHWSHRILSAQTLDEVFRLQ